MRPRGPQQHDGRRAGRFSRPMAGGRDGGGAIVMRGIEFAAAGLVLLFGAGLLLGYIAAERVTCF